MRLRGRDLVIVSLPAVIIAVLGVFVGWIVDPGYTGDAMTAVVLTLPPVLFTVWFTVWISRQHSGGVFFGMSAGMLLKAIFAVGGGAALFFGTDWYVTRGVSLWVWVIVAYLATLTVEVVVMTRRLNA
ncbi:hypothetical protein BH11PLA2_BH11PLA2_00330 [soil metagenome]